MFRVLGDFAAYRDWRLTAFAGLGGAIASLAAMGLVFFYTGFASTSFALAMVAAAAALALLATILAWRVRRNGGEQHLRLDEALNNMNQGLCMFDAQNRLVVWNERYREMYGIDTRAIWRGCTVRDLLDARIAAGTFPLDPGQYNVDLQSALRQGRAFTLNVNLADGRTIAVVNQPMQSGGWVATHEDVTERRRAEQDHERTRTFLDTIIEHVPSPIIVKDAPGLRYLLINRAAEKYLGVNRVAMLGKTAAEVMPSASAERIEAEDRKSIASGEPAFLDEHSVATPGNGTRFVTATRLPVRSPDGTLQYLICVINDLTEHKRSEQRIEHMAQHDSLTELPNRAAFNHCIASMIGHASVAGESFALLSLDIDRFKSVNDVYGHDTGDALLREVARRLETACQGAFIARLGGDEFAVITPTGVRPAAIEALTERLSAAMDSDIEVNGNALRIGLTIGVGIYPQDGIDAPTLIANTDAALFRAKSEMRGSVRFFEMSMDKQLREKRALQQDLRSAISRDELAIHFQPQAHINGEITGFEALIRWHHPRHGLVPPSTFVPLAEESGLIIPLGEWILRAACREAASWPRPLRIAINLSPVQFRHGDLPRLVHQILLETGLSPSRLELEITEGVLIDNFTRAVAVLRRLKGMGVRIAMDDFGTGYSSLSYLQSFPFDKIKIDQAFVANLGHSQQATTIIRAVMALGRGLNLPVVAEGVETEDQRRFLAAERCSEIQGYLVGRPKPIAEYAHVTGRAQAAPPRSKPLAAAG
jgi:diguanylate cyclase (GGDEF)-like protein/PAS domain S-box-containing protein